MKFSNAISQLADELGITQEEFTTQNILSLVFDDKWEITCENDTANDEITFSVPVRSVGIEYLDNPKAARKFLTQSLLGTKTGGCAVSFSEDLQCMVLWKRYPDEFADEDEARNFLSRLADTAAYIEEWIMSKVEKPAELTEQPLPQEAEEPETAPVENTSGWFRI